MVLLRQDVSSYLDKFIRLSVVVRIFNQHHHPFLLLMMMILFLYFYLSFYFIKRYCIQARLIICQLAQFFRLIYALTLAFYALNDVIVQYQPRRFCRIQFIQTCSDDDFNNSQTEKLGRNKCPHLVLQITLVFILKGISLRL